MTRRTLLAALVGVALGLASFSSTGITGVSAAENIPVGESCKNSDSCAEGLACYANTCAAAITNQPSGFGNECDSQDCCPNDLDCSRDTNTCVASSAPGDKIQCVTDQPTITGVPLRQPNAATTTSAVQTSLVGVALAGAAAAAAFAL